MSLKHKTFSPEHWKWQHRLLMDAVRQYGYPSFFLTISPLEWTFPWPHLLEHIRDLTGKGPTELPCLKTARMAHVLEQLVRGHLCGTNINRWHTHAFRYSSNPARRNVETFFYLHMLVWLKDVREVRLDLIRATIPWAIPDDVYLVQDLQSSDSMVVPVPT